MMKTASVSLGSSLLDVFLLCALKTLKKVKVNKANLPPHSPPESKYSACLSHLYKSVSGSPHKNKSATYFRAKRVIVTLEESGEQSIVRSATNSAALPASSPGSCFKVLPEINQRA